MPSKTRTPRRKPRLRTELSAADEAHLQQAVEVFGLPKAEVVRRLIRASVQAGPALSAENTQAVALLASQVRMVGRNLMQLLRAIHRGQAVRIEDTEAVWLGLQQMVAGFAGHRYAARVDVTPSGALEARIVVAMAGTGRERFRVREERNGDGAASARLCFDRVSEAVIAGRIATATGQGAEAVELRPAGTSHGRDGVTYRLNGLVQKGAAVDDRGSVLAKVADTRLAARDWSRSLRSQSSRDTLHLVISAKAGTDAAALTNAVRAFLHDRFADHKFMFGVHTDKEADGHIHAHAVITVKNEVGQKIHPGRETFREWRKAYAEHAQAQGLKIVATSARERASSQSYGPCDKAIVDAAERPRATRDARDRAYASNPNNQRLIDGARHRMSVARGNPIRLPTTDAARQAIGESVSAWRAVAQEQPDSAAAQSMLARLTLAHAAGAILHRIGARVDHLTKGQGDMAITSEKMVADLRAMNEAVSRTSDLLEGQTKQQFLPTGDAPTHLNRSQSVLYHCTTEEQVVEVAHEFSCRRVVERPRGQGQSPCDQRPAEPALHHHGKGRHEPR